MQNKSRNWTDVQMLISSISIAITLGVWGLFATQEKAGASVSGNASLSTQPDPVTSNTSFLLPGQTLYFGGATSSLQQPTVQPTAQAPVTNSTRGGRNGGSSGRSGGSH